MAPKRAGPTARPIVQIAAKRTTERERLSSTAHQQRSLLVPPLPLCVSTKGITLKSELFSHALALGWEAPPSEPLRVCGLASRLAEPTPWSPRLGGGAAPSPSRPPPSDLAALLTGRERKRKRPKRAARPNRLTRAFGPAELHNVYYLLPHLADNIRYRSLHGTLNPKRE